MDAMSFVAVGPEVALLVGVLAVLLVEITLEPDRRVLGGIAGVAVVAALALSVWQWSHVADVGAVDHFSRMVRLDGFTAFGGIAVFTVTGIALLGMWPMVPGLGRRGAELLALVLLSAMGLHLMAASGNLIMLFVALEIASISLYVIAGFTRERADADEAAMKYFLLGSFASAVFLYGIALLYAATGSTYLYGPDSVSDVLVESYFRSPGVLLAGIALLIVGLGFKVSAAPFHQWAPDVYQGAPTGTVGFMAAGVKIAGFAAIVRVLIGGLGSRIDDWAPAVAVIAAVSIIVGTGLAIAQTDIKRMLAYSGVAHAGFILTGVLAGTEGIPAVWFYVATYAVQLVGAFVVVSIL
ncbi:MAG: NADH-quinone oxidoreductase subunit N, partial [Acidimicrobiia bacterium]|nr:NADH-quinone oxidoreductase subunit N [Acidimicrobiia bacterium]